MLHLVNSMALADNCSTLRWQRDSGLATTGLFTPDHREERPACQRTQRPCRSARWIIRSRPRSCSAHYAPELPHDRLRRSVGRALRRSLADGYLGLSGLASRRWAMSARPGSVDTPLRTERARRSALVEIDALVAVWLGMDVDALIAIYRAAFPVLNRYEETTWFDANGWKLAGYHRTLRPDPAEEQLRRASCLQRGSGGTNPPPDGYTPPFYKADREAEYRQAHAVFSERLRKARGGG